MQQMNWYGIGIKCGTCQIDAILQLAMYSADSELRFTFWCPKCKELIHWNIYTPTLQQIALRKDLEKAEKSLKTASPLKPPLAKAPEKLTNDDRKLLHEFGIGED